MSDLLRRFAVTSLDGPQRRQRDDLVAHEEPLEIQVNGGALAVLMRTPGHDEELVRGFLLSERIVASPNDIDSLRHCTTVPHPEAEENVMQVRLRAGVPFDLDKLRRHSFASSSCGVCGKATLENACQLAPPVTGKLQLDAAVLASLPTRLRADQPGFDHSGGLHAAGLFGADGAARVVREDVGRHNAVDKTFGFASSTSLEMGELALVVSGRVSFEIVQKAVALRVPLVAGVSAPTSLAVRMAEALGVTLVGFLRGATMNIYSGGQRIR